MEFNRKSDISTRCSLSKLGNCEVCSNQESKYTCPQCEVKTCSLNCNKIHKAELECSGQRDRTKFIPIKKFTNLDLHSDYTLLEEISRSLESSRKKFGRKWNNPEHLTKIRNAAKFRKINLKFLPYNFERRKSNTTFIRFKDMLLHWHIEWVFANAECTKLCDEKIPENEKISSILAKYLELKNDHPLYEKLQFYQAAGMPGLKVLLKAEQKNRNKYYEVDVNSTLKETLYGKIIIECPIFYVVLKDHACSYDVIDSDDEESANTDGKVKSGHEIVDSIIKKADSQNKTMKNLLFVSEHSDDDLSSD